MDYTYSMKPARQRIIDYLVDHKVATASELSYILNLTSADVRHHISVLIKQGSITTSGYKHTKQKGRPARLYALSAPMARDNLNLFIHYLLSHLSANLSTDSYQQILKDTATLFVSDLHWETENLTRRLYQAIAYLRNLNYDSSWEARARSPHLIFGHCPFAKIVDQHPEMCVFDAYLLQILLGKPVQQIEKLTISSLGLPQCKFSIADNIPPEP